MTLRTGPGARAPAAAGGVVLVALVLGCGVAAPPEQQQRGEGPGHRDQPLALTPQQELAVGLRAYREVMQESEADHVGVFLMPFAGYDPDEAVEFWKRMLSKAGHGPPEFLSDHPSPEHRIRDLEQWAPKAKAAKAAYDQGNIAPPR